jgi:hypothetical protein
MVRTFLKVYMEIGSYFLFLQEQIKDIIIITPTYTVRRDGPAREPSWSAFWLQKPSILRACVREEDARGKRGGRAFYYTYIYS